MEKIVFPQVLFIMRIAVLSDIHGNFQALLAVLADLAGNEVDRIVTLGDNVGYGPEPEEVIKTLTEQKILSVVGNHELALRSRSYFQRLNSTPRISLEITCKLMSRESFAYCLSLPVYLVLHGARFVHGCPPESVTTYLWNPSEARLARIFAGFTECLGFFGHTHAVACYTAHEQGYREEETALKRLGLNPEHRYLINPGSVGQPRDGISNHAKYGIWDLQEQSFTWRAVPYDVQKSVRLLKERKFPRTNADRLL